MEVLDVYLGPLLLVFIALYFFVLAVITKIPTASDLTEVRGHLESYYFWQTGRGKGDYTTIISLEEDHRFWTDALDKETAPALLKEQGREIRTYMDFNSTDAPINSGSIKSYGLWVDGKQVISLDEALSKEKSTVRFWRPVLGMFFLAVAIYVHRYQKAMHAGYG